MTDPVPSALPDSGASVHCTDELLTGESALPTSAKVRKQSAGPAATVRHGSASVPIYRIISGTRTRFAISWYRDGKRMRQVFRTIEAAKKEALTKQIASAAPGSSEMKRLQSEFNVADHKLFTNQAKLGQHRQYYTGRKMANEFSSAFSGKDMGMRDENKPFFNGDISQQDDDDTASEGSSSQSLSERRPSPAPMEPQRQASLPKAPMKDDRWNVVQAQQQHGSNDDLQYDAYGNVIFE